MTGPYTVRMGGFIVAPRIGRLQVKGLTLSEAEKALRHALGDAVSQEDRISLKLLEEPPYRPRTVSMTGAFLNESDFELPITDLTVSQAVADSSGWSPFADLEHVRLIRKAGDIRVESHLNVGRILDGGDGKTDILLLPGDEVRLAESEIWIRIEGEVAKPGSIRLKPGEIIGAGQAIERSGGLSPAANRRAIQVIRAGGKNREDPLTVDLEAIASGEAADVALRAGDKVLVSATAHVNAPSK